MSLVWTHKTDSKTVEIPVTAVLYYNMDINSIEVVVSLVSVVKL